MSGNPFQLIALLAFVLMALMPQAYADEHDLVLAQSLTDRLAERLPSEEQDVREFYQARQGRLAWNQPEVVAAFASALYTVATDGLNITDYEPAILVAKYRELQSGTGSVDDYIRLELQLSRVLMTVLNHLQHGKVDPHQIDVGWEVAVEVAALDLTAVSEAVDAQRFEQAFALARPWVSTYQRLRAGLAQYRNLELQGGWPTLPDNSPTLRPGDVSDAVVTVRSRLLATGELAPGDLYASSGGDQAEERAQLRYFDAELEEAVKRFQQHHLLDVDGIIGRQTRIELNVPVAERIDQIRVNMERARWLLHGDADSFVLVDIAGYRISYFRPNGEIWRSRIVVGQPYRRTPSLRSSITHLTVNPTWTVPPGIYRNDILPRVRRDIGYLDRRNMQVLNYSGQRLDPYTIDWSRPGSILIRQDSGPDNALGQIVLRFPNNHLVYLHDTPSQYLFTRQQRAFSSGCIRVQGVMELAQLLFDDSGTNANVEDLVAAGQTRNVHLRSPVRLILHYWTVHPGDDGELVFRPDIYTHDAKLLQALDSPLTDHLND